MKIGVFGFDNISSGKQNLVDQRLDTIKQAALSAKKAYLQAEIFTDFERLGECDGIISAKDKLADLILTDLEFIEKRLDSAGQEQEKKLLSRFKAQLENEQPASGLEISKEEKPFAAGYSLLTFRPVYSAGPQDAQDLQKILTCAYNSFGYIAFFTANEKEARSWPIKKGTSAWEAAGLIHSDIQKGFIRAEVIAFEDLTKDGGINQARANNHLRLEGKEYIVCDADLIKFRFGRS